MDLPSGKTIRARLLEIEPLAGGKIRVTYWDGKKARKLELSTVHVRFLPGAP